MDEYDELHCINGIEFSRNKKAVIQVNTNESKLHY